MKTIKNIAVLTSGGDAPGMNAAIRAVVRTSLFYKKRVFGVMQGFNGLMNDEFVELDTKSVKNIINLGGTILKSARSDAFRTLEGRKQAYDNLIKNEIDGLIVIGGNGSFTGAHLLFEEYDFPVIGIPGTIDNDLYGTERTIGYDTANNTVIECVDKIRDTASSHNRLFLVEVMGRDSGFIALNSAVATGAVDVILPEENQKIEDVFKEIDRSVSNKKTSNIIIVAEGNKLGNSFELAEKFKAQFKGIDTKVTILGHLQRGGSPTVVDRVLASQLGVAAVEGLLNGQSDVMVGIKENNPIFTFLQKAILNKAQINFELLRISKILST